MTCHELEVSGSKSEMIAHIFQLCTKSLTLDMYVIFTEPFVLGKQVILGHSSMPFKISFTPNEEGLYSYIYAAYCRLFDGRTCERRRSTQFAFDKISDRPDEQYTFRRPEKKHVCEHVLTFHSKKDDKFVHTLVHKTSIVDPADPEILALNFNEDGTKPRRLSRYHCSEASNSGSEEDGFRPPKKSLTKKELSRARINAYLQNVEDGSSDLSAQDAWPSGGGNREEGKLEGKFNSSAQLQYSL